MLLEKTTRSAIELAQFLGSPLFVWGWCSTLFLLAIRHVSSFLTYNLKLQKELIVATQLVAQCKNKTSFSHKFIDISAQIALFERLKTAWKMFSEQTTMRRDEGAFNEDLRLTVSFKYPEAFFTSALIKDSPLPSFKLFQWGLIGSFMMLLSHAYIEQVSNQTMHQISGKLGIVLSLCLWPVLCGILVDFLVYFLEKKHHQKNAKILTSFNRELTQKIEIESIAKNLNLDINDRKKQNQYLQKISEKLISIDEKIGQEKTHLSQEFLDKNIVACLDQPIRDILGKATSELTDTCKKFNTQTTEAFDFFLQRIVLQLKESSESLQSILKSTADLARNLNDKSLQTSEEWSKSLSLSEANINKIMSVQENLTLLLKPIAVMSKNVNFLLDKSQNTTVITQRLVEELNRSVATINQVNTDIWKRQQS